MILAGLFSSGNLNQFGRRLHALVWRILPSGELDSVAEDEVQRQTW